MNMNIHVHVHVQWIMYAGIVHKFYVCREIHGFKWDDLV